MTPKKLEKLWQEYSMQESDEKRETLDTYFKEYGDIIKVRVHLSDN